jgi:hypothetical protein
LALTVVAGGSCLTPATAGDQLLSADDMWQDKFELNVSDDSNCQPAYR